MDGLVVVGGTGRLAAALGQAAPSARLLGRRELDITLPDSIAKALDSLDAQLVINTAAIADVDRCEADPDLARAVNALGAGYLATACAARGVPLIHVSTDYVFGSVEAKPFVEADTPCPWSVYGASKALGEALALEAGGGVCVARVAWLFGHPGDFLTGMLKRAVAERRVNVFAQIGSPTPLGAVAERLLSLAAMMGRGAATPSVLHLAGGPPASRAQWLGAALSGYQARHAGFSCDITEVAPPSGRPPFSALDTALASRLLGASLDWRAAAALAGSEYA